MVTEDEIREVIADIVGVEVSEIKDDTNLYSFPGFDSVEVLGLLVALDDIGFSIDQGQISRVRTLGDLLKLAEIEE